MGHVVAGQWKPYQYLVESIRKFPCQVNICEHSKSMVSQSQLAAILLRYGTAVITTYPSPQEEYYVVAWKPYL